VVDELKAIRAQETDPVFQRKLDEAIRGIDSPMTPMPKLPDDTPPEARKLMEDLHAIPYARKGDVIDEHGHKRPSPAGAGSVSGPSLVDQLAEIYRDVAASRRPEAGMRSPADRIRTLLRNNVHEVNEGSFPIWELADRAGGAGTGRTPLETELRTWERAHIPTGQMTAPVRPRITRPRPATAAEATERLRRNPFVVRTRDAEVHPSRDGSGLTGVVSHPRGLKDIVAADTPPEGLTVRGLVLDYSDGGHIEHGTVWKHNGTVYLAEHAPTPGAKKKAQKRIEQMMAVQDRLRERQPEVAALQHSYSLRPGASVFDAARGVPIYATAHQGTATVFRNGSWADRRPGFFEDILRHEVSHNALQNTDVVRWDDHGGTPSAAYRHAMETDNPYLVDGFRARDTQTALGMAAMRAIYGNARGFNQEVSPVRMGVTNYGRGDHIEESAEAFALHQMGIVGWDRHDNPVFFRDLFPGRAAEFDRHFPQLRDRHLQAIQELRGGKALPRPAAPDARSVGIGSEDGVFMNEDLALLWLTQNGGISNEEWSSLPPAVKSLLSPEMLDTLEKGGFLYRTPDGRWRVRPGTERAARENLQIMADASSL
jgi:hypothetical protein